jgi:hypothetical protein
MRELAHVEHGSPSLEGGTNQAKRSAWLRARQPHLPRPPRAPRPLDTRPDLSLHPHGRASAHPRAGWARGPCRRCATPAPFFFCPTPAVSRPRLGRAVRRRAAARLARARPPRSQRPRASAARRDHAAHERHDRPAPPARPHPSLRRGGPRRCSNGSSVRWVRPSRRATANGTC